MFLNDARQMVTKPIDVQGYIERHVCLAFIERQFMKFFQGSLRTFLSVVEHGIIAFQHPDNLVSLIDDEKQN